MKKSLLFATCLGCWMGSVSVYAIQFPNLDPAYTQEIYTGPLVGGPGMAWTGAGAMLTRNGSDILEYSLTQNAVHQGTNVHGYITHGITGLATSGYGMTNGTDGYVYVVTGSGLQRFDPSNWGASAQTLTGTVGGQGYGIHVLPSGKIAYVAGGGTNEVYVYDPVAATNTLIYTGAGLIDDIASDGAGNLALAGQSLNQLIVISGSGAVLNTFNTVHYPDGLAFGDGVSNNSIFANNNDGTVTRYTYGAGYTGTPIAVDIASGSQAYGDLAEVGPDCAFYVTQFDNNGYHGSTAGIGTHWDNGTTNNEASVTRIARRDGNCGFYHAPIGSVPEPVGWLGLAFGVAGLASLGLSRRYK